MYYPSSKNKGDDQLRTYCEADLRLCFRIGKNDAAHMLFVSMNRLGKCFIGSTFFLQNHQDEPDFQKRKVIEQTIILSY